jgi:methylmalonyl-CoA/ethylmalonyl-CoA epimerase
MGSIIRINHVAIVVEDLEYSLAFWRDSLGLKLSHVEDVPDQESLVAFLPVGDAEVELVKPTSENSGVARYLKKRGAGVHHICFEVDNIDSCLQILKERQVRLINEEPIIGTGGKRIAFLHPESTHGVLVELYELTAEEPAIRLARARSLADRVVNQGQVVAAGLLGFLRGLRVDGKK